MYLLKAEATVRAGKDLGDAKEPLKTVMGHAGITDFTKIDAITDRDELLYEIYKETVKNLMFEDGIEWSMLLRFPHGSHLKSKTGHPGEKLYHSPDPSCRVRKKSHDWGSESGI